nr:MAG TPA: hypothetical protein [Caudoviricetes sp.]
MFNIFFLPYRGEPRRMLYQKEKLEHLKATLFITSLHPTTNQ